MDFLSVWDFQYIYPQIIILAVMLLILLYVVFLDKEDTWFTAVFAIIGLAMAGIFSFNVLWAADASGEAFCTTTSVGDNLISNCMLVVDRFSLFFNVIFVIGGILAVLSSIRYIRSEDINHGEYYMIILGAVLGMMIMAAASNLLTIFVGIETLSISLYILAGFNRRKPESNEAALKYLLLGAFSTGFLLYGMSIIYGTTGSLDVFAIARFAETQGTTSPLMIVGVILILVGLSFKASLVPFHQWAPDVYQGAPTPVTGLMSTAAKAAAFAVFLRVLNYALPAFHDQWRPMLYVIAIITMTVGNITAITQVNIKRMLAYSSISHAGYIVVAVLASIGDGAMGGPFSQNKPLYDNSILFYLLSYTFMNMGAFGILAALSRKNQNNETLSAFAGLARRHPIYAAAMAFCMFSLAGIPPTAGFMAKFYIFAAAVEANLIPLVIIGVLNAVVSVYYYLRVVVVMYMHEPEVEIEDEPASIASVLSIAISLVGIAIMGIMPSLFILIVQNSYMAPVLLY